LLFPSLPYWTILKDLILRPWKILRRL
jgi:hypothetical protein